MTGSRTTRRFSGVQVTREDVSIEMNITLWIVGVFLAIAYLAAGAMKMVRPHESLVANHSMAWAADVAPPAVKAVGFVGVIGAVGLILPQATGHGEVATPLAPCGRMLIPLPRALT